MTILVLVASLLGFAGLTSASRPMPEPNMEDLQQFLRIPELSTLFTNASYTFDPEYQKDLAEFNAMVQTLSANTQKIRSGAQAPPQLDPHGRHYCVGVANYPYRTRVYENRMTCDIEGFNTAVSFCLFKTVVATKNWLKREGCLAIAGEPTRSMYYGDFKSCARNGWNHDFALTTLSPVNNRVPHHYLNVWFAMGPHRINFSPAGVGLAHLGWTYFDYISATTITYPVTPDALKAMKPTLPRAVELHKRILPIFFLSAFTAIMAYLAVQSLNHMENDAFHAIQPDVLANFGNVPAIEQLAQELMRRPVPIQLIRTNRASGGFEGPAITIQFFVDGVLGAVVLMEEAVNYGRGWIRQAFHRSLMDRQPITMVRVFDRSNNRYIGYLYGTQGGSTPLT